MWNPINFPQRNKPPVTRCLVTAGLSVVTLVNILWPEMHSHYGIAALTFVINLVWLWR